MSSNRSFDSGSASSNSTVHFLYCAGMPIRYGPRRWKGNSASPSIAFRLLPTITESWQDGSVRCKAPQPCRSRSYSGGSSIRRFAIWCSSYPTKSSSRSETRASGGGGGGLQRFHIWRPLAIIVTYPQRKDGGPNRAHHYFGSMKVVSVSLAEARQAARV